MDRLSPRFPARLPSPRRLVAPAFAAVLLLGLAACGRELKSFTPTPESTVTWTGTVSHLFADRSVGTTPTGCTSCHHAGTTVPDWTDYDTVYLYRSSIASRLGTVGDRMRSFTGPGEADVIISWINAGAPK